MSIVVSWTPSRYKRRLISLNGEPWRDMNAALFKKNPFFESYPSMEDWLQAWNEWEAKQVKRIAYEKLSRKRYFLEELKALLSRYGFAKDCIEAVLDGIAAEGYLNDADGVEALVNRGIRQKKSPAWIKNKIKNKIKNIENELWQKGYEEEIENSYPIEVQESIIRELLLKKGKKGITTLARKGFPLADIMRIYAQLDKI